MTALSDMHMQLIDGWQRDFPLDPDPYARIAFKLGLSELSVLGMLSEMRRAGVLSRIGAIVEPNTAGASTLAAMAVPRSQLETVAALVNKEPGVNHNYEREHRHSLWFVLTGRDRNAVEEAIGRIERRTGLAVLNLPLRAAYHIDLGFPLGSANVAALPRQNCSNEVKKCVQVGHDDLALLHALEDGLPIHPRPYGEIARRIGTTEDAVTARLGDLVTRGVVKRFGLIVRHRELGFRANAMVVWDIADDEVDEIGARFASYPFVTLCYRRDRQAPHWPYNLFCMIHGRDRPTVLAQIAVLCERAGNPPMDILFSRRCFKQRGPRLSAA